LRAVKRQRLLENLPRLARHNALGRQLFRKLKVYKGAEHPHGAQQPQVLALDPATAVK
jgi:large subunit ribosomal protein L13